MNTYAAKRERCAEIIQQAEALCEVATPGRIEAVLSGERGYELWAISPAPDSPNDEIENEVGLMQANPDDVRAFCFAMNALPLTLAHLKADLPEPRDLPEIQEGDYRYDAERATLDRCYATCELLAAALKEVL